MPSHNLPPSSEVANAVHTENPQTSEPRRIVKANRLSEFRMEKFIHETLGYPIARGNGTFFSLETHEDFKKNRKLLAPKVIAKNHLYASFAQVQEWMAKDYNCLRDNQHLRTDMSALPVEKESNINTGEWVKRVQKFAPLPEPVAWIKSRTQAEKEGDIDHICVLWDLKAFDHIAESYPAYFCVNETLNKIFHRMEDQNAVILSSRTTSYNKYLLNKKDSDSFHRMVELLRILMLLPQTMIEAKRGFFLEEEHEFFHKHKQSLGECEESKALLARMEAFLEKDAANVTPPTPRRARG